MGTHGQKTVTEIHEDQDEAADASVVVEVTRDLEGDGDNMVAHHLPVVLSPGLGVEHKYLVQVACSLEEVVKLDGACERCVGITSPDGDWVQDGGREVSVYVLRTVRRAYAAAWLVNAFRHPSGSQTYAKDAGGRGVRRTTPKHQLKV